MQGSGHQMGFSHSNHNSMVLSWHQPSCRYVPVYSFGHDIFCAFCIPKIHQGPPSSHFHWMSINLEHNITFFPQSGFASCQNYYVPINLYYFVVLKCLLPVSPLTLFFQDSAKDGWNGNIPLNIIPSVFHKTSLFIVKLPVTSSLLVM